MAPTLQPQFLPETDIGELSQYRVSGSFPINGLLKELIAHRALIALYARGNFDDFVVTQVTRIDDRSIDFAFVTDDARRSAILASDGVIVIGFPVVPKAAADASVAAGATIFGVPEPDAIKSAFEVTSYPTFVVVTPDLNVGDIFVGADSAQRAIDAARGG